MRRITFTFLFFLAFPLIAFADTEAPPIPYTAETADKRHIFVVLTPNCGYFSGCQKYRQSGMYPNDGSTTPLWTVDWQNRVFLPNDGKHIVRQGSWARYSATYHEEVFSFISEGNLLKTYKTDDLTAFPYLLPHSSSHYKVINSLFNQDLPNDGVLMKIDNGEGYPLNSGVKIDNENKTFEIETLHGDKYIFDLQTGNIISLYRPSRNVAIGLFCVLVIGYFGYLFAAAKINLTETTRKTLNYSVGFFLTLFLFLIPVISVWLYGIPSEYQPDYSKFSTLCYVQISMLPRYLLTSLNVIPPAGHYTLSASIETAFCWFVLFWLPLIICLGLLNHLLVSKLKPSR